MFKKCVLIFVSFLYCTTAFAQYPTRYDQNTLVSSNNVDEELLLFIPDTASQILFNPARAFNYEKKFLYATYNSGYQGAYYSRYNTIMRIGDIIISDAGYSNPRFNYYYPQYSFQLPTISVNSLFKIADSKYLFSFSNGIRYSNSEDTDDHSEWYSTLYPDHKRTINSIQASDSKLSTTRFHLSKIDENYSIGIFGVFNQMEIDAKYKEIDQQYRKYESASFSEYSLDREYVNNDGNQYLIGASLGLTSKTWDFVGKISYQNSNNLYDGNYEYLHQSIDSTGYDSTLNRWNVYNRNYLRNGNTFSKSKPDLYQIYSYYQKQLSWLSKKDHIFAKANVIISKGSNEYNHSTQNLRLYAYQDSITYTDSIRYGGTGKINSDNNWINLSIGYAASVTLDDIYLLISIIPYYQYSQIKDISFNSQRYIRYVYADQLNERKRTINSGGIKIPIFINFTPASWINLYGGLTYNYGYFDLDEEYFSLNEFDVNNANQNDEDISKSSRTSISSANSKFLGLNLKHKSGVSLQISFNNDIANFSSWDLSLGYHF